MDVLRVQGISRSALTSAILVYVLLLSGCEFSYIVNSGFHQAALLRQRVPLDEAIKDERLSPQEKAKVKLAVEAREFSEKELHLRPTRNYTTYVHLDRPYVSYVVSAAQRYELEPYLWSYPMVGRLPYKGFFSEKEGEDEVEKMKEKGYDVFLRGVSAYSTLGWFRDPLLSSMLRYDDSDLVNVIIHETTHATLFIKGNADFNERLATYVGNLGTELFYLKKEGPKSRTNLQIARDNQDDQIFSVFISREIDQLKNWYQHQKQERKPASDIDTLRKEQFQLIKSRFEKTVLPTMKTTKYRSFGKKELNNAVLLSLQTYLYDLSDFELAFEKTGKDFRRFLAFCRSLESAKDPEQKLKEFTASR